ncbi:MAG TPA: GNAT family N-acetyltransferase [Bacteroidales bacterium]|nr:GNAT family N-acetyltransferase [Bacteroidales bacterium]
MEYFLLGEVSLRKLDAADNLTIAALANNRKVWDNITDVMPHPYSVRDANAFISMALNSDTEIIFAIEYQGKLAGVIGLHRQKDVFRLTSEIGYWLGEPYWNKGIATNAVKLATHHGITRLGLVRIFANVYDFNKASQRVLEKGGYKFECVARKAIIKNGVILDDFRYSFLDEYLTDDYLIPVNR